MMLLDTSIVVDSLRGFVPAERLIRILIEQGDFNLSSVTVLELIQGCLRKQDLVRLEKLIQQATVLPLTPEISDRAIATMARYHLRSGMDMGDSLIVATAIERDCELLTRNLKHVAFVEDLVVRDPFP